MDAHQIGLQLRALVLRDRQQGLGPDPRRLQAVIGDLCTDGQTDLVAPLRYLVLSAAFASAAGMDPPLSDGRQLPRLQQELAQMYAAPLCARLQPVLEGLLGMPAATTATAAGPLPASGSTAAAVTAPAATGSAAPGGAVSPENPLGQSAGTTPAAWVQMPQPVGRAGAPPGSGGAGGLNTVLAFLSGLLLMAFAGVGLLLWQRHSTVLPQASAPGVTGEAMTPSTAPASSTQPVPSPTPSPPATTATETSPPAAAADRAAGSIQQLYQALSAKDFNQAAELFGSAAADQFDPSFFRQFERVTVQDLHVTSEVGATLNLSGVVTFVWPDGSLQTETRSFSVDTSRDPAQITASEFGQVLTARR